MSNLFDAFDEDFADDDRGFLNVPIDDDESRRDQIVKTPLHGTAGLTRTQLETLAPTDDSLLASINQEGIIIQEPSESESRHPMAKHQPDVKTIENYLLDYVSEPQPNQPNNYVKGQTKYAIPPDNIIYYYFKIVNDLTRKLTVNQLNITNNQLIDADPMVGSLTTCNQLNITTLDLNDYFIPNFDTLYRNCVSAAVLQAINRQYRDLHIDPANITPAYQAGVEMIANISSLAQSKSYLHKISWMYFSLAVNNTLDWQRKNRLAQIFMFWQNFITLKFEESSANELLDLFDKQSKTLNTVMNQLIESRKRALANWKRQSGHLNFHEHESTLTLFEAQRFVNPLGGNIIIPKQQLFTTLNYIFYEGVFDRHLLNLVFLKQNPYLVISRTTEILSENLTYYEQVIKEHDTLASQVHPNNDISEFNDLNKGLQYTTIHEHRNFYSALSLNILPH